MGVEGAGCSTRLLQRFPVSFSGEEGEEGNCNEGEEGEGDVGNMGD